MKNLTLTSVNFLILFLLYLGCKEDEQIVLHQNPGSSTKVAKDTFPEGKWNLDSLTLSSATLSPPCSTIESGTIFEFSKNDSLKIFPKMAADPCDTYRYKSQNNFIHIIKDDMVMLVEYELLNEKALKLTSKSFFRWQYDMVMDSTTQQQLLSEGITAFLSKY